MGPQRPFRAPHARLSASEAVHELKRMDERSSGTGTALQWLLRRLSVAIRSSAASRSTSQARIESASLNRAVAEWCRRHRHHEVQAQHAALKRRLVGHFNYFGVNGNARSMMRVMAAFVRTAETASPHPVVELSAEMAREASRERRGGPVSGRDGREKRGSGRDRARP